MPLLPFLKNKRKETGVIVQERVSDLPEESTEADGLEVAAKDIMSAISGNDHKALAAAIRAAFEILESQPHVEGEHTNEEVME